MNKIIALLSIIALVAVLGSGAFDTCKQPIPGDPGDGLEGQGRPSDSEERASHTPANQGDPGDAGDGLGGPQ